MVNSIQEPKIKIKSNFVSDSKKLWQILQQTIVWDDRMFARKTASFGVAYNYSGIFYPDTEMHHILVPLCQAIAKQIRFMPNNCLLNYYPDGKATMGYHSDSIEELEPNTGIIIISLGAERVISFRNKANKTIKYQYLLACGSLLYMSQDIQKNWMHSIPKQMDVGGRISLTFRAIK